MSHCVGRKAMAFKHCELDRGNREIRLLEILGSDQDARFKNLPACHIFHAALTQRPSFVALSYTWGGADKERVILVDGYPVYVSTNLFSAIMTLRCSDRNLVIWIDALCINQEDNLEKSWQVGLMKDIYQQASMVLAWLGTADDCSDRAMSFLDTFGQRAEACGIESVEGYHMHVWRQLATPGLAANIFEPLPSHLWTALEDQSPVAISRQRIVDLYKSMCGLHGNENRFPVLSMQCLFTRPWWGRVWVLQELTLPREAYLVCGNRRVSRSRCRAALSAYISFWITLTCDFDSRCRSYTSYHRSILTSCFHHRPNIMLSGENLYRRDRFPLVALLRATCVGSIDLNRHGPHNLESTDPRDKVFALLSLASDSQALEQRGIVADYTMECKDIYTTTMAALLEQGHISLLSMCQSPKVQDGLPSWVIDWSRSATDMLQDVRNDHVTVYPSFATTTGTEDGTKVVVERQAGLVRGVKLPCSLYDEIKAAGSFPGRSSSNTVPLAETDLWPRKWLIEMLCLTYLHHEKMEFRKRLGAVTRASIGDVGFGPNSEPARVGDARFPDAVTLLRSSEKLIKQRRIKLDAEKFLKTFRKGESPWCEDPANTTLEREIIGKSLGRLPFITNKGHLVLSSEHVRCGDVVALIAGAQVPFILRQQKDGKYSLISEAYVDGIMDGDAMEEADFNLVQFV